MRLETHWVRWLSFSSLIWTLLGALASPVHTQQLLCDPPKEPHSLELCSPLATGIATVIVPEGLEIHWFAPPRTQTSYLGPLQAVDWISNGGSLPAGETVPGISLTGTYLGVRDQRIEITILEIGSESDSGVVGLEPIRVAWSSVFLPRENPNEILEFEVDAGTVDLPLQFEIKGIGEVDTTAVPGVRITFSHGQVVHKGSTAVFDVEDFDGFHVWRWRADPTQPPLLVGAYNKVIGLTDPDAASSPSDAWPNVTPIASRYIFLDRFVVDGNVYHYAITTFDQGFNWSTGEPMNASPFDSPPWDEMCECMPPAPSVSDPGPTVLRVEFRRASVTPVEWSKVKALYRD